MPQSKQTTVEEARRAAAALKRFWQRGRVSLARLEGSIAIARFLERFPRYELSGTPTRGGRARFRGFLKIPCRVEP